MGQSNQNQICSILLVDDDPIFSEILLTFLHHKPVKVLYAKSLAFARKVLAKQTYHVDIVLLDNVLTDGFGIELMPDIQQREAKPLALMITADDDQESINKCFELGVHDYMVKPINNNLLWAKIQRSYAFLQNARKLYQQNAVLEDLISLKAQEERLARHVYASMAQRDMRMLQGIEIIEHYEGQFSGDFVFTPQTPDDRVLIFLADAMGHGLAAAFCILPVIGVARSMASKGKSLQEIFHEVNHKLYIDIPDDRFVALSGLEINWSTGIVTAINAGLPSMLIGTKTGEVRTIQSKSMPLGILSSEEFSVDLEEFRLEDNQQIALFSDGVIEQMNEQMEPLGATKFMENAQSLLQDNKSWVALMDHMLIHAGTKPIDDDATLCVVDCDKLIQGHQQASVVKSNSQLDGRVELNIEIKGRPIAELDPLQSVLHFLNNADIEPEVRQKAFTIAAELVNNAIDHGILGLDSALKNDAMGFAEFLEAKERGLKQLTQKDSLVITVKTALRSAVAIEVKDSGTGFDYANISLVEQGDALSGRGLKLIEGLSDTLERNAAGNYTKVTLSRN